MNISMSNPAESVIRNLALTGMPQDAPEQSFLSSFSTQDSLVRPLPLPLPQTPQGQFNQMFRNVIDLFRSFVGAVRDLGLGEATGVGGTTGTGTSTGTGSTTGTDGAQNEQEGWLGGILDKVLSPFKDLMGSLGDKLSTFVEKAIEKPASLLDPIKNIFKKAKKAFSGNGSLLTKAFNLIKSFI